MNNRVHAGPIHDAQVVLEARGVSKSFGGTHALREVSLKVCAGRVTAVVGENGAGKSTLMNVLAGLIPSYSYDGSVHVRGEEREFFNVSDARSDGIVLIPQELYVAGDVPLAENMFAGALPTLSWRVDRFKLAAITQAALKSFDLEFDPYVPARHLSGSEQRLAMIAAALSGEEEVLILDEPTASLSEEETNILFQHLRRLRDRGMAIVLISHRLDDIEQIADSVVVLRNGAIVLNSEDGIPPRSELIRAMVGRYLHQRETETVPMNRHGTPSLLVKGLTLRGQRDSSRNRVTDVSFSVFPGEILGIYGLVGAGRTELAEAIYGVGEGELEGEIEVEGRAYQPRNPRTAIKAGIAYLGENRKVTGIFGGHNVRWNLTAASLDRIVPRVAISRGYEEQIASEASNEFDVRPRDISWKIDHLSGGNQQKVLVARCVLTQPSVLILDEPTTGVDVGAREEIYNRIRALASENKTIVLISSDRTEIATMCHRTLVMYRGRITARFGAGCTRLELMSAATGGI